MNSRISRGDKFGRWTILGDYKLTDRKEKKWLCQCECGTERYVLERALIYGGSTSCGCLRKESVTASKSPDLTGKVFGELTVLSKIETAKGPVKWLCQCSCGRLYETQGTLLVNGRRTRCSSKIHKKNYKFADITGERFDMLIALYPTDKRDDKGFVIWRCRCDCGNEVDVSYNHLLYTTHKSCGCQKKEHDKKVSTLITRAAGTSIDIIKSKKIPSDNTTGYKGVYFIKGKYTAKIVFQKKAYYLGNFDDIEQAAQARKEAEEVLFDGVANHYLKWKERADKEPNWAEENPVQVYVYQNSDKSLSVKILPELS